MNAKMNRLTGFVLVCSAGLLWSFGSLIIRYMVEAQIYQWQYLFFRGLTIGIVLLAYILIKEGGTFITDFINNGVSGFFGAFGLVGAFIGFIWSITLTTVANAMFMMAATPFIAAFMGSLFLKEKIRQLTWIAMLIALSGILVMVAEGLEKGNIIGTITALFASAGFAVFSVSLRWKKETPQFTTIALAGILCVLFTMLILFFNNASIAMPVRNICLSMLHGFIVSIGLILFAVGAKFLPAAKLTLLSQVEVVGGVFWVYIPIFGIHEIPSLFTMIGGVTVLIAIVLDSGLFEQHSKKVNELI